MLSAIIGIVKSVRSIWKIKLARCMIIRLLKPFAKENKSRVKENKTELHKASQACAAGGGCGGGRAKDKRRLPQMDTRDMLSYLFQNCRP